LTDVAWVALSLIRGVGAATLTALVERFGSAEAVFAASDRDLLAVPRIGKKTLSAIRETDLARIESNLSRWGKAGVTALSMDHPNFPPRLHPPLPDAPALLFARGTLPDPAKPTVAIVGTRDPSPGTAEIAETLGRVLAAAGYIVVSGLACGVDSAAHRGALSAYGGQTVAVLGSGVLKVYPSENRGLAGEILEVGALLCEVSPDTTVSTPGLVARNRLISALADTVIIVETSDTGGAMHAARAAVKQGRRLVALDYDASGNRQLIDDGHALALHPDLSNLDTIIVGD
jgi:DNA processing protein